MSVKDEFVYEDKTLSLKKLDGWYLYGHMSRTQEATDGSGQGVAVLVYTMKDGKVDKILGRFENCLPHKSDADGLTSITGGVDVGSDPMTSLFHELDEEAGIWFDETNLDEVSTRLHTLGTCRPSKQEDSLWHLFAFDATGLDRREKSMGDGTKGEEGAYCEWVEPWQALGCKCPLVATMMVRAGLIRNIL
jgi:hypothetical protein